MAYYRILWQDLILDYHFADDIPLHTRVLVPVRTKEVIALVIGKIERSNFRTKSITEVIDTSPVFSHDVVSLIMQASSYYQDSPWQHMSSLLPSVFLKKDLVESSPRYMAQAMSTKDKATLPQLKVYNCIQEKGIASWSDIKNLTNSPSIKSLHSLIEKRIVFPIMIADEKNHLHEFMFHDHISLNKEQQLAVEAITLNLHEFKTHLLYGITGSGKSAVYAHCIRHILERKQQVLIVVPEINLTNNISTHLEAFFQANIGIIHSEIDQSDRLNLWHRTKQGLIDILIVTRSGVFYDLPNLGMIIVDEEHDSSLKSHVHAHNKQAYNAKHVAIMRAKHKNIPIILGSATPSLESFYLAQTNKYCMLRLEKKAVSHRDPVFDVVDMKKYPSSKILSTMLINKINTCLQHKQQVLLFINLLGFSTKLVCNDCSRPLVCPSCDRLYTFHKHPKPGIVCRICNSPIISPPKCLNCGGDDIDHKGVRIEKLEEETMSLFPQAKIVRLDSTKVDCSFRESFTDIQMGVYDIVLGTQMVVKGHDFANISLIGIIDIDGGLYSQDYFALENMAQNIAQVAGRAGRRGQASNVVIQTRTPNTMKNFLNYENFLNNSLLEREGTTLPPFYKMACIYGESLDERLVELENLRARMQECNADGICNIGQITPAMIKKRNHLYKKFFIISALSIKNRNTLLLRAKAFIEDAKRKINIMLDVDPVLFY